MKKLYSLVAILLFTLTGQAQVTLGLRAGSNLSSITQNKEHSGNTKFKFGPTGGIYATIKVNKNFSVQPELLYTSQGYKSNSTFKDELTYKQEINVKSDYLSLPILAKYKFKKGYFIELGPQVSYLLGGQLNNILDVKNEQGIITTISDRTYFSDADLTHDFDVSGVIGGGYAIRGGYSISARYTYGFTNFIKDDYLKIRNQYFSLTLGIPFTK